jgi:transposase
MARPSKEDSIYRVAIHKNAGHMYASTHPYSVMPDGKRKYSILHWGTVDQNLRFTPGKHYISASPEERSRLIFPDGWDLSQREAFSVKRNQGRPAYEGDDQNRLYGDVWLLEQVALKTGIRKDLLTVFDGNIQMVNSLLTLAFFPYLTGHTYNRLARWQRVAKTPSDLELTPTMITRLTQSITESERMELFRLRAGRLGKSELCAVDSTSRSAYGDSLADIKWGRNKEGVPLEQTLEVVVYSLDSHMPIYYRTFPGNIPDSRSVETILTDLNHAGFPKVILVTDRGYESLANLERYILGRQQMIMCVKVRQHLVMEKILELGVFSGRPEEMSIDAGTRLYHKSYDLVYRVVSKGGGTTQADRLKLNLYFDAVRRGQELTTIDIAIESQRQALQSIMEAGERLDDDISIRKNYNWFDLEYHASDRTLVAFTLNKKKVATAKRASGFFANMTLGLDMGAMEALDAYSLRDEQEKYFQQMKGQMGFDKQRCWSEEGKTGRLFVLFVALIISSYVRHIWKTTKLKETFSSTHEVLDEMRSIRCIEHRGRAKFISPFVGSQLDICKAFGFEVPKGCTPIYHSRKKSDKKRGRSKKKHQSGWRVNCTN